MKLDLNIKGTMFKIVTMLLVILIQTTGIYAFNASETYTVNNENNNAIDENISESADRNETSKMESKALDAELIVKNTSTQALVGTGQGITYTVTVSNPNALSLSNVKLKINTDTDDVSKLVKLSSAKDKTGNDLLKSGNVSLKNNIVSIQNLPEKENFTIKYSVSTVFPGFNDDTDITNNVTLFSSDQNLVLSADSVTGCNVSKIKAEPFIFKFVEESVTDGTIMPGEIVTYRILIENDWSNIIARNVNVRDSMLEQLPDFVTYNDDLNVKYYNKSEWAKPEIATSGNLANGDFTIAEIPVYSSILLTYSIRVNTIPIDVNPIFSVATSDGTNPIDEETGEPITCSIDSYTCSETQNIEILNCVVPIRSTEGSSSKQTSNSECCMPIFQRDAKELGFCKPPVIDPAIPVTDPMKAKTEIYKSLTESNPDGIADIGETLKYQIEVVNNGTVLAYNTVIRDSMLENLPSYVTFNEDIKITTDIQTTGDLTNGDYTITSIPASSTATITYSITVDELPNNVAKLTNIATKGGSDPDICLGDVEKCSEVILPLKPIEITEENKKEPTSETNVNTEDSIEPKSSIETTLTEQPTEMKKLTTTGGLEVIATLFLAISGMFLVTLKRVV